MALGTLLGALATAGISAGASKLFGGSGDSPSQSLKNVNTSVAPVSVGINAGGLSGKDGTLSADANRMGLVGGVQGVLGDQADALAGLRARLAPGMSDLRTSRLAEVENARQSAIGNLRENMARRRVLGSSFGQDALTRAESEFGQQKDKVAAETFLQEVEGTHQLINQEFEARRGAFQAGLDELNLQADIGSKLAAAATAQMGANARLESELRVKAAAGGAELQSREQQAAGKFFGQTFSPVANEIGKGVSNFASRGFNPLAGAFSFGG